MNTHLARVIFFSIFTLFTCSLCAQAPKVCNKDLVISSATAQKWNPGIVQKNNEQRGGIKYELKIKVKKSGYVTFKKLIIEDQVLDVELIQNGNRDVTGPFNKGDEITLIARSDKSQESQQTDESTRLLLKKNSASALVLYSRKGNEYVHVVSVIAGEKGQLTQ